LPAISKAGFQLLRSTPTKSFLHEGHELAYAGERDQDRRCIGGTVHVITPFHCARFRIESGEGAFVVAADVGNEEASVDDWRHGCAKEREVLGYCLEELVPPF